jgi:hypothetical protein
MNRMGDDTGFLNPRSLTVELNHSYTNLIEVKGV